MLTKELQSCSDCGITNEDVNLAGQIYNADDKTWDDLCFCPKCRERDEERLSHPTPVMNGVVSILLNLWS